MEFKDYLFLQLFQGEKTLFQNKFVSCLSRLINNSKVNVVTKRLKLRDRLILNKNQIVKGVRYLELNSLTVPTITHKFIIKNGLPSIVLLEDALDLVGNNIKGYVRSKKYVQQLLESHQIQKIIVPNKLVKSSLILHYGGNLGKKIEILYPIETENKGGINLEKRTYDFCFINEDFITNGGVEVVKAFDLICKKFPTIKLCIATNLDMARYYLGDLNQNPNISWKHYHNTRYLNSLLKDSEVYLMPNLLGEFSTTLIEALKAGCLIVTTDYNSYKTVNEEGVNGFALSSGLRSYNSLELGLIKERSLNKEYLFLLNKEYLINEIYNVMHDIISSGEEKVKMMFNSRKIFEERFSNKAWNAKMGQILCDSFGDLPIDKILQKESKKL